MTRTITQVVSPKHANTKPSGWTRAAIVAAILALCSAFLPAASAECHTGGGRGAQAVPSMPSASAFAQAAVSLSSHDSNPRRPVSIVGLWNVNVYSGDVVVDVAFDAWHADGTEVLND